MLMMMKKTVVIQTVIKAEHFDLNGHASRFVIFVVNHPVTEQYVINK